MQAVVPAMMARGWGRVVNITSRSVKAPLPALGPSNAARAGLTGFVAGMSRQVAGSGVTVNNVLPGSHRYRPDPGAGQAQCRTPRDAAGRGTQGAPRRQSGRARRHGGRVRRGGRLCLLGAYRLHRRPEYPASTAARPTRRSEVQRVTAPAARRAGRPPRSLNRIARAPRGAAQRSGMPRRAATPRSGAVFPTIRMAQGTPPRPGLAGRGWGLLSGHEGKFRSV